MCCACLVRVCSFQVTWCGPGNFRNHAEYLFGLPGDFIGVPVISLMWYHNGMPEQLRGCVTAAPIRIGSHSFAHHIFISHTELEQQDLILGQPFLQWFAARLDYNRSGPSVLLLWKDGDRKTPPTLSISIMDPADPRNTTTTDRKSQSAYVEETVDEEGFRC